MHDLSPNFINQQQQQQQRMDNNNNNMDNFWWGFDFSIKKILLI